MKGELPKPLVVGAIVAAVLVLGLVLFKAFSAPIGPVATAEDEKALMNAALERERKVNEGLPPASGESSARGGK